MKKQDLTYLKNIADRLRPSVNLTDKSNLLPLLNMMEREIAAIEAAFPEHLAAIQPCKAAEEFKTLQKQAKEWRKQIAPPLLPS